MTPATARIALLLGGITLVALNLSGCGSNIPLDGPPAEVCDLPGIEECAVPCQTDHCLTDGELNEIRFDAISWGQEFGYGQGYKQGLDECGDVDAAYNEGYEDGVESVVCNGWTCADFNDGRPNGHKPKECR